MIKGETVILVNKVDCGVNDFGETITESRETPIDNVLIGSPSVDKAIEELNVYGKHIAYILGVPKGDNHNWKDCEVIIRGERFKSYGFPLTQTDENVPTPWNTQVKVELYE